MARCWTIRRNLTAWIDGESPYRQAERIQRHLTTCATCSAEAERLRAAIRWQRQALPFLVAAENLDPGQLRMQLQRALAAEPAWSPPAWKWLFRPVAITGAAVMIGIVLVFSLMGGPKAVLIPLGVEPPPLAVTREPDLFENYQLIQHLDVLENFDTVESEPLDDDPTLHRG
jgi:anti-sigma factor RsiW